MKPTNELRWKILPGPTENMQPILQQRWVEAYYDTEGSERARSEWRDVPFVATTRDCVNAVGVKS